MDREIDDLLTMWGQLEERLDADEDDDVRAHVIAAQVEELRSLHDRLATGRQADTRLGVRARDVVRRSRETLELVSSGIAVARG
jgi:hypothetical protein